MKIKLPKHKTKIVCTIGPASRSQSVLKKLVESGMDVARLNFAHGSYDEHRENIQHIRSVAAKLNRVVAIMADLPGPKIRIGKLQSEPLTLNKGESITLTTKEALGTVSLIPVDYINLTENVSRGNLIYINDGFIQLRVQEVRGDEVRCKVIIGGQILSHKGLNLPGAKISAGGVTAEDMDLVNFALEEGVDALSVSFVKGASDILKVKEFVRKKGKSAFVVAKIERREAVKNIDEILEVTDALMIARGDLGVEIPIQDVPGVQKRLIRKANLLSRPVITATQMLESMTSNIRPTRAEATDVANAILDGTDAVMLSEETAIGRYPVEAVKMMAKIAVSIERQRNTIESAWNFEEYWQREYGHKKSTVEDTISLSVFRALHTLDIRCVLTPTSSGNTPRRISRFKPECWILSFSSDEKVRNCLALSYGVYPILMEYKDIYLDESIIQFIKDSGLAKKSDRAILTEGVSHGQPGGTNSLKIITIR